MRIGVEALERVEPGVLLAGEEEEEVWYLALLMLAASIVCAAATRDIVALFLDPLLRCKAIIPLVRFVGQPTGAPAASQPTPNVSSHDHCGKTLYFTQITSSTTTHQKKNTDALPAAAHSAGFSMPSR